MRRAKVMVVLGALALIAAGCGEEGDSDVSSDDTARPAGGDATVAVHESDLGPILVDGEGRTLYLFMNDEPGSSTCSGSCAERWPPLGAPDELVAGDGADETLLGTTTREDGTEQVTYASMPLYRYAADSGPGEVEGQGVGDVWYVAGPDGEAITSAPADAVPGY